VRFSRLTEKPESVSLGELVDKMVGQE
jgi:hypothetical protein